ncbi:MAG TPA: histidine kinase dimerization/phosphoacceptor domain -containing protein, partial [Flavobacteriales bacterium]|nr:histidine kinase dimerization/phosphoacceptor domain -containing protein [Flavobacteriales bacterium]
KRAFGLLEPSVNYKARATLADKLGNLYYLNNQYAKALYYAKKKHALAARMGNEALFETSVGIGGIYHRMKNIDSAIVYMNKAESLVAEIKDNRTKSHYYNTIADFYREIKAYRKAINFHNLALGIEEVNKAWAYTSLGKCYIKLDKPDSAILYFNMTLERKRPKWIKPLKVVSMYNLALCYKKKNDLNRACMFAKRAKLEAESLNDLTIRQASLQTLYDVSKALKDQKTALESLEELNRINDSLSNENSIRQQTNYEFSLREEIQKANQDKRELALKKQKSRVETELKQRNVMIGIAVGVLLLVGTLFFLNIRNARKVRLQNQVIQHSLKEKEALLREIHHRVKNNLQIINSLLNMQMNRNDGKTTREVIKLSQDRIHAMSMIHERLYKSSDLENISVEEYLSGMCEYYRMSYDFETRNIKVNCRVNTPNIHIDRLIPLGLIVNELLINSVKYAFDQAGGVVDISCTHAQDLIIFTVTDNGKGLPADYEKKMKNSLGIQLVQGLSKQLKARLEIVNNPGASFKLEFKHV